MRIKAPFTTVARSDYGVFSLSILSRRGRFWKVSQVLFWIGGRLQDARYLAGCRLGQRV
jgi:hypothetical protein